MNEVVLRYIRQHFREIPTSVSVGFLLVFVIGTLLFLILLGFKNGWKWSVRLLLCEYLFFILSSTVLFRAIHEVRQYNLIPLKLYRALQIGEKYSLAECMMNSAIFVPVGLMLGSVIEKEKWWIPLFVGGGFSILIELSQLIFRRGVMELDDLLLNVLGCMIGYGLYLGVEYLINLLYKRDQSLSKLK